MNTYSTNKWQKLTDLVNQHPTQLQVNLAREFKKLFLVRWIAENLLVCLLQYIGLMFSTITPYTYPLWFASGTACAFVFLRGFSVLPAVALGSFFAFYFSKTGMLVASGAALIFTFQAFLLLWLSYRFISPSLVFYSKKLFLKFIICSAVLTGFFSFLLEVVCYSSLSVAIDPVQLGLQWWLANWNGVLIFAFALVSLDAFFPQIKSVRSVNKFSLALWFGGLFAWVMVLLFSQNEWVVASIATMIFIWVLLICVQYGWCGVVSAIFLIGLLVNLGACFDAAVCHRHILFLQIMLCVICVTGLLRSQ